MGEGKVHRTQAVRSPALATGLLPHQRSNRRVCSRKASSLNLRDIFQEQSVFTEQWEAEYDAIAPSTASSATVSNIPLSTAKTPGCPMEKQHRRVAGAYSSLM
ncbi:hypothetical protein OPT61_g3074 [Boeremia exigua]|uniref:Uncharacterized protein n=1 Tax=Boeremia exigua TaxID=749465 RepID=A0ACC2IJE8_9PLEO|nr:hypothetical protein OPT61_g3074 [Boeremia exigua]